MDTWSCGPHRLEFEPPDVFHCHVRGRTEEQHVKEAVRLAIDELCTKRGLRLFFVVHLSTAPDATYTPGARQYVVTNMSDWKGIILVGGSPLMRMTATVLARANALLRPRRVPYRFAETMDDARRFMAEIRAKEAVRARVHDG